MGQRGSPTEIDAFSTLAANSRGSLVGSIVDWNRRDADEEASSPNVHE